jgi:AcrR family transcriptional regulator
MDKSLDTKAQPVHSRNLRQTQKAKTRHTIMKAAKELFSRQGIEETRAEEIARRAKVGVGTIYLHFGDKNGLLRDILLEAADDLYQRILQVYQSPPTSPLQLARAHVEQLVRYIEENGRISGLVLGLIISGHPSAVPMLNRAVEQVEKHIIDGQEKGIYRQDINPQLAARAETQMNLGLLAWWAADVGRASREEIIDTLAKFRLSGLYTQSKG